MNKLPKLSFKKYPKKTGLAGVGFPFQSVDIKSDKKLCGIILAPNFSTKSTNWRVGIMVMKSEPDNNPNCNWKWVYFKKEFENDELAKEWVKEKWEYINTTYNVRKAD